MTAAVMMREPLHALDDKAAQRNARRRTAHDAFDGENDSVQLNAKKAKVDSTKLVNGRSTGDVTKRRKQSYNEEDNGFQFSRTSRSKSKSIPPPPAAVVGDAAAAAASLQNATPPATAVKRRKKMSFSDSGKKSEASRPTRRSARLSGEKEQIKTPEKPKPTANVETKTQTQATKKIPLPFADTPVIRRNKDMRKKTTEHGHRRSSTGIRGRRASSLIDSGTSNAVPHAEVETREFYKHIEQSLPEPRRMRQLLTWCGTRALPQKQSREDAGDVALRSARHIEEEILKDMANKSEMSDWFNREDVAPAVLVKRANPRNTQMSNRLLELEEDIKRHASTRLQSENAELDAILKESSTPSIPPVSLDQPQPAPPDGERRPKLRPPPEESPAPAEGLDVALLDPSQLAIYNSLMNPGRSHPSAPPASTAATLSAHISALAAKLEPAIDIFADGVHKVAQLRGTAERVADKILGSAAEGLEERSREVRVQAASERGVPGEGVADVRDVLNALAGVLNGD